MIDMMPLITGMLNL